MNRLSFALLLTIAASSSGREPPFDKWPDCSGAAFEKAERNAVFWANNAVWNYCKPDLAREAAEKVRDAKDLPQREKSLNEDSRNRSQIIDIPAITQVNEEDNTDAPARFSELKLLPDSQAFKAIADLGDEKIYPIVVFGTAGGGKSTLASFLSCAMDCRQGFYFPTHSGIAGIETSGMWASPVMKIEGKNFVIFDLQGQGMGSLNKDKHLTIIKLIALMTEVASVFVYSNPDKPLSVDTLLSGRAMEDIGHSFKTTREHLLKKNKHVARDDFDTTMQVVRTVNNPSLVVTVRYPCSYVVEEGKQLFKDGDEEMEYCPDYFEERAQSLRIEEEYRQMLIANFATLGKDSKDSKDRLPWILVPVIEMNHESPLQEHRFDESGVGRTELEGCKLYSELRTVCSHRANRSGREIIFPSRGLSFKTILDNLARELKKRAPLRLFKSRVKGSPDEGLTGRMFADYIREAVKEMNLLTPLPETQLWKKIMEESCDAAIMRLLQSTIGEEGGAITRIKERMKPWFYDLDSEIPRLYEDRGVPEEGVRLLLTEIAPIYDKGVETWTREKDELFRKEAVYKHVQASCEETTESLRSSLKRTKEGLSAAVDLGYRHLIEKRLWEENKDLKWSVWWAENQWRVAVGGIIGFLLAALLACACQPVDGYCVCLYRLVRNCIVSRRPRQERGTELVRSCPARTRGAP